MFLRNLLSVNHSKGPSKRVQQHKIYFIKHCRRQGFWDRIAQIRIRLSLVRVRESNNVLQAVQTNQTFFIKLENKRNVLRCLTECLTEIKLRKTSSNIIQHRKTWCPNESNMFYKTMLDDVLRRCFTPLDGPWLIRLDSLLKMRVLTKRLTRKQTKIYFIFRIS